MGRGREGGREGREREGGERRGEGREREERRGEGKRGDIPLLLRRMGGGR